ncbi:serine/threonine-protein kinase [Amycolatopsis sp. GM8]|uniref:serine/threonine-protein kinase n=1 Tax=Amycolatopsis sp. GM8 TaxID=2896530 RepID=UPI001F002AFC|nr:serine/threonine-protein kinase [Amycolatopsis sp. GM8]
MRPGQLVGGRYRLDEEIDAGGNGVVWRAHDHVLDRTVALKHALSPETGGADRVRQLRREATILAKLSHPNVVTVFDTTSENGQWWLVMEYAPAPNLARHGKLPPERVARYGAQLAYALQAVHEQGVVHRDIKPANVLVTADNRVKLSDFGISRVMHGDVTVTDSALIAGTPGYIAPEVAKGHDPTPAADMFSLGATLYAVAEGVSPFGPTDNQGAVWRRTIAADVAAPDPGSPLAPVLSRLMDVNPAKRPTAAEARLLLEKVADGAVVRRPRRWRDVALVTGAVVVVVAAVAWLVFSPASGSGGTATPLPAPVTSRAAVSLLGDPRTADPCALSDASALARFGEAERDAEYGNFDRCDVIVRSNGSEVDVKTELDTADPDGPPAGAVQTTGQIGVVREPLDGEECDRTLLLGDGNQVAITAQQNGDGPADLCAMADTATDTAVTVLSRGEIPRRVPADPASLIKADACALLDADALSRFPGVDAVDPEIGFGDWSCRWHSTTSQANLLVRFDRNQPPTADDGQPTRIAGRQAFVERLPDDHACQVEVVYRRFSSADTSAKVELLLVVLTGSQPLDQLCGLATSLAEPAAAKLPAT